MRRHNHIVPRRKRILSVEQRTINTLKQLHNCTTRQAWAIYKEIELFRSMASC